MRRVLHVYPSMNNAGTEMVMMNLYKNIDRTNIQFDFLVQDKGELDDEIRKMGGNIYYIKNEGKVKYFNDIYRFLKNNIEYNIIHTHTHSEMGIVLKAAKKANVKCRIAHSHNSRSDVGKIIRFIKKIKSMPIKNNATHFFACSVDAGNWLFPYKNINLNILPNGISLNRFKYNQEDRLRIRDELKINDKEKVICHVGRFAKQKNHEKIIDIFNEVKKEKNNVKLILVGIGPLEEKIKQKVKLLNLDNDVIFLGNRNDVNEIMSASDLFLFPSLHEGLGIVLIEAQTSGMKCIVSSNVPDEAKLDDELFYKHYLDESVSIWSKTIIRAMEEEIDRSKQLDKVRKKGYDIKDVGNKIYEFYNSI